MVTSHPAWRPVRYSASGNFPQHGVPMAFWDQLRAGFSCRDSVIICACLGRTAWSLTILCYQMALSFYYKTATTVAFVCSLVLQKAHLLHIFPVVSCVFHNLSPTLPTPPATPHQHHGPGVQPSPWRMLLPAAPRLGQSTRRDRSLRRCCPRQCPACLCDCQSSLQPARQPDLDQAGFERRRCPPAVHVPRGHFDR